MKLLLQLKKHSFCWDWVYTIFLLYLEKYYYFEILLIYLFKLFSGVGPSIYSIVCIRIFLQKQLFQSKTMCERIFSQVI